MPHESLRWICVGTGDLVRKRAGAALAQAPGGRLLAICGQLDRAVQIASRFAGVQALADLQTALASTDANAVYICSPVHRHSREALLAINAGRHVLVEKPLGLDHADAMGIVNAASQAGVSAGCAYYRRMSSMYQAMRRIIQSGDLGRIVHVRMANTGWYNPSPEDPKRWRVEKSLGGGGPLADVGSHMLDMLIGLLGMPRTLFAHSDTLVHDYSAEDGVTAVMTMESGAHVTGRWAWNEKPGLHEFEIVGTQARLLARPGAEQELEWIAPSGRRFIELEPQDNPHLPLVADFNDAVIHGRPCVCPVAEAALTHRLIDAIYASAIEHRMHTLD